MPETWLRPNRRILAAAAIVPLISCAVGAGLWLVALGEDGRRWLLIIGAAIVGLSVLGLAFLAWQAVQPRLASDGRNMLVNLGTSRSIRVPLEVVEGFLLGQGPSFLPCQGNRRAEVANLVVRLAERAADWEQVEVNRQLGSWCGHYITIRGTFCEGLSVALVNHLNARLAEAKRMQSSEGAR